MLVVASFVAGLLMNQPLTTRQSSPLAAARVSAHPICAIRESRVAKVKEWAPGERYRNTPVDAPVKFYNGRNKELLAKNKADISKKAGKRKIIVLTGGSSGLGLFCIEALLKNHEGYFVIAAVRDPEKMVEAAEKAGLSDNDYTAMELQLASFQVQAESCVRDEGMVCASGWGAMVLRSWRDALSHTCLGSRMFSSQPRKHVPSPVGQGLRCRPEANAAGRKA
jgi:hypothetical protein